MRMLLLGMIGCGVLVSGCDTAKNYVHKEASKTFEEKQHDMNARIEAAVAAARKKTDEEARKLLKAAEEKAEKEREAARIAAQSVRDELTQARSEIAAMKAESHLRDDQTAQGWRWARLFFYTLGGITCVRLIGRPIWRVVVAKILSLQPIRPRQVIEEGATNV